MLSRTPHQRRDALTGAPIQPGERVRAIPGQSRIDLPATRDGTPATTSDVPGLLHTHTPDGALGGRAYSPQFAAYLSTGAYQAGYSERRSLSEWWRSEYGMSRVRHQFIERDGETRGTAAFTIALALCRDEADVGEIAEATNHTVSWVDRQRQRARRYASERSAEREL